MMQQAQQRRRCRQRCTRPCSRRCPILSRSFLCSLSQDEQTLILHQREKHYRCPECTKKLNTAKALSVHCLNVHKRALTAVPAALSGREDPAWDIFGMAGVPVGMKPGDEPPHKPGQKAEGGAAAARAAAAAPAAAAMPPYGARPHMGGPPAYGGYPGYP